MGNASRGLIGDPLPSVHPHVHGERSVGSWKLLIALGSSPRTWGTQGTSVCQVPGTRFIPTYMGNAGSGGYTAVGRSVHPHVHGERAGRCSFCLHCVGSSPRTWGTLLRVEQGPGNHRFIPTYMGNAHLDAVSAPPIAVHPHVHGERVEGAHGRRRPFGSSPRTWGTQVQGVIEKAKDRFIPTYMGNARQSRRCGRPVSVHPHVHGERTTNPDIKTGVDGSSPRTWGTHRHDRERGPVCRFIPTYMGNAISETRA